MSVNEERISVLTGVQNGTLDIAEASRLLQALADVPWDSSGQAAAAEANRSYHILKTDLFSGEVLLDVSIPINLVNAGLRIGATYNHELSLVEPAALQAALGSSEKTLLVEKRDATQGECLQIFLD